MEERKVFRVAEIVGCEVVTVQGESLGRLRDVLPTGGNDVFVVGEGKAEILIPALKSVVLEIDPTNRRITVDLPDGLKPVLAQG